MPVSLSNSKDIVANSISLVRGNRLIGVLETIDAVQGLAPETLNSLEKLANALNNDSNYFATVSDIFEDKADKATTYTKTEVNTALNLKANQSSLDTTNSTVALKANQATTYTKTEVDTALNLKANQSSLDTTNSTVKQRPIPRRRLIHSFQT